MSQTRQSDPPERILIIRALPGLGDLLCAVPAFRALRKSLPAAHVTLLGLPVTRGPARRFRGYLDDFLEFPGFPGIPEGPSDPALLQSFLADYRGHYNLALQFHGDGRHSNLFTQLLEAKAMAGFHPHGLRPPTTGTWLPWLDSEPEPRRWLRLLASLGLPARGEFLEFPLTDGDYRDYRELRAAGAAGQLEAGSYVCLHAGASTAEKRFPAAQLAAVADLAVRRGLRVVLTGTARETPLAGEVRRHARHRLLDLTGRTSLGALAVLLKGSRLLVCNDTGISHLAAALKVPSVVIFTSTDPARWAPLDRNLHRIAGTGVPSAQRGNGKPPEVTEILRQVSLQLERSQPETGRTREAVL